MRRLTEAQVRALRLVVGGHTRIRDLKRERVGRVTIDRLTEAGLIDTGRFPGAVYATFEGRELCDALAPNTTEGRTDRAERGPVPSTATARGRDA